MGKRMCSAGDVREKIPATSANRGPSAPSIRGGVLEVELVVFRVATSLAERRVEDDALPSAACGRSCHLMVITTDDWHTTNSLRQQLGSSHPFLYDKKKRVRDELGTLEYTDTQHEPMIPHTFLLGPELRIHKVWNSCYYRGRPSVAELHPELREFTRAIRADLYLYAEGLKRKWDAGDKSAFYPHDVKSMERMLAEMAGAVDQYAA